MEKRKSGKICFFINCKSNFSNLFFPAPLQLTACLFPLPHFEGNNVFFHFCLLRGQTYQLTSILITLKLLSPKTDLLNSNGSTHRIFKPRPSFIVRIFERQTFFPIVFIFFLFFFLPSFFISHLCMTEA